MIRTLYRFLSSVKLAMGLLVVILAACVVGVTRICRKGGEGYEAMRHCLQVAAFARRSSVSDECFSGLTVRSYVLYSIYSTSRRFA